MQRPNATIRTVHAVFDPLWLLLLNLLTMLL